MGMKQKRCHNCQKLRPWNEGNSQKDTILREHNWLEYDGTIICRNCVETILDGKVATLNNTKLRLLKIQKKLLKKLNISSVLLQQKLIKGEIEEDSLVREWQQAYASYLDSKKNEDGNQNT